MHSSLGNKKQYWCWHTRLMTVNSDCPVRRPTLDYDQLRVCSSLTRACADVSWTQPSVQANSCVNEKSSTAERQLVPVHLCQKVVCNRDFEHFWPWINNVLVYQTSAKSGNAWLSYWWLNTIPSPLLGDPNEPSVLIAEWTKLKQLRKDISPMLPT